MPYSNTQLVIYILGSYVIIMWLGALMMGLFALPCSIRVQEISFGVGKLLFCGQAKETLLSLRLIPFSAYIKFSDNRFEELKDDPKVTIDSRPRIIRFLILLSGALVILIPGVLQWGMEAVRFIPNSIHQLVAGAISPFGQAQVLLHQCHVVANDQGFLRAFGIISIKLGVFYFFTLLSGHGAWSGDCRHEK